MQRRNFLLSGSAAPVASALPAAAQADPVEYPAHRVRDFHAAYPVCDMLGLNLNHPRFIVDNVDYGKRHDDTCRGDFPKFREWGLRVVMCKGGPTYFDGEYAALWRKQPEWRPGGNAEPLHLTMAMRGPTQMLLGVLDRFLGQVEANTHQVHLIQTAADLDLAHRTGKLAVLMGANRSDWFGDTPGVIRIVGRLGLRMITVGQGTRELGYDVSDETRSGGRMTKLGVRMIGEMNRAGILVDVSHLNAPCALDAIEVSERPVVASHSNPRALDPSLRNVPDTVMKALARRGGMLGITPPISRPPAERPLERVPKTQIDATVKIIRYAVNVMGADAVGIGTHFNSTAIPWVTDGLLNAGFSDLDVAKVMGGNYLRVLRQVLPAGGA